MAFTDIEVVKGYIRMCNDGWLQGWHERNGGNLTYRLRPEEVEQCRPYMNTLPGGADIAMATSELMKEFDAAVWAHHGLFCSGPDFDITFGLMHTIEKAAEIYVKAMSMGQGIKQTISDDNLRAIARDFGVTLREEFLD